MDSNKITQTTFIHSQSLSIPTEEDHPLPRQKEKKPPVSPEEILSELLQANGIPADYRFDQRKITAALKIACGFEDGIVWHLEEQQAECETVFEALRLMCCRPKTKVRNKYLEAGQVIRMLNERCIEPMPYGPDMTAAFEYLVDAYATALQERASNQEAPLRHPVAYAKYVIWDAIQIYKPADKFQFMA